jgi:PAS domain S-box-containing protein
VEQTGKSAPAATDKANILIVDDKKANIIALEAILAHPDYNLVTATSGAEGLRYVLRQDFAVVLLDVMMPEMDGFEFARLLRQRERSNSTPIIFLTAIAKDARYLHQGYAVGAVDYLQKPLEPEIVKAKVAVFVELFRKNQQIREQERQLREAQRREQEYKLAELRRQGERHYQELAEAIPQIVWTAQADGRPSYFNRKWFDITGMPYSTELCWEVCRTALHPADAAEYFQRWEHCITTGGDLECEARIFNAAAHSYHWHLCRALPERNEAGEIIAWLGTYTDIHSQKRAEMGQKFLADISAIMATSLDYEANLMRAAELTVSDLADVAIVDIVDDDGSVRRAAFCSKGDEAAADAAKALELPNKSIHSAGELLAYAAQAETTVFIDDMPPDWFLQIEDDKRRAVFAANPISSLCSVPISVRGKLRVVMTALYMHGRRFDQFDLQIANDVRRTVCLAIENALVHKEVQETNRMKDEFLAVLSHELRTPLNAVIGWSDLLRLGTDDEKVLQGLEIIERNGKALNQLVGDLLDVSRIITGKLVLDMRPIDMNRFIVTCIEGIRPLAERKNIRVECQLPPQATVVQGDQDRLQQVMWNLLTNALKFTPDHGTIGVYATSVEDNLLITVSDSGIGLKSEVIPYIFERFRQADSSTTRKHGGLGLGLAIVKHVTDLHEGSVTAQSDGPGHGARFTVSLPLAVAATTVREPPYKDRAATASVTAGGEDLAGTSVFVVDDDPTSRDLIATFLKRRGATVSSAGSVPAAIAGIRHMRPDVVLTDIGMPDQDGYDLLEQLKPLEVEFGRRIHAAALTAYASSDDALRAIDAGFELHITKPIKFDNLISAVAKLSADARRSTAKNQPIEAVK